MALNFVSICGLFCLITTIIFTPSLAEIDGNMEENKSRPGFRPVKVRNNFENITISVFWLDAIKAEGFFMFDILPASSVTMDTTNGHSFYATEKDQPNKRVPPTLITIKESVKEIAFAPKEIFNGRRSRIHPSVKIIGQRVTAMSAKFRSLVPSCDYYYEDGRGGQFQGTLQLGKETTTNTYEGHVFFFTEPGNKDRVISRFTMTKSKVLYVVRDEANPPPEDLALRTANEAAFMEEYFNRTGIHWRHFYGDDGPRPPPSLFMWPAENIGDVKTIMSTQGFWFCEGSFECQSHDPVPLEMEVVSIKPRVFIVSDFLSSFEAEMIIKYAKPAIKESTVGNKDGGGARKSDTRTSRNAWVSRDVSRITDTLFRRAADLLQLDESILRTNQNVEDMQVVHYVNGQKYDSHHDWGVSGYPESRLITLLIYLTDMPHAEAGGETAFPKGANGRGFKVQPKKGDAVLFYNLLEDGNGDDLALHAALPVLEGEKWLANFWVWDPQRRRDGSVQPPPTTTLDLSTMTLVRNKNTENAETIKVVEAEGEIEVATEGEATVDAKDEL